MKRTFLVLVFLILGPGMLVAHDDQTSVSELRISGRKGVWTLDLGVGSLGQVVELPTSWAELTDGHLQSVRREIAAYLLSRLGILINGEATPLRVGRLEAVTESSPVSGKTYISRARQEFLFEASREIFSLRVETRLFQELSLEHRSMMSVKWDDRGRDVLMVGPGTLEVSALFESGAGGGMGSFFVWGAEKVLGGAPHLLFLGALVLAAAKVRRLATLFGAFALAQAIAMTLAAFGVIGLSERATGVLIAASIAYLALENLVIRDYRHRWMILYGIGLFHGLGLGQTLRGVLPDRSSGFSAIAGFDFGATIAQVIILALCVPAAVWLRGRARSVESKSAELRWVWGGSCLVFAGGLTLFLAQILGVSKLIA